MVAQNRKQSESGGLVRLFTLNLESKVMLAVNIGIQNRFVNDQMRVVKLNLLKMLFPQFLWNLMKRSWSKVNWSEQTGQIQQLGCS